MTEHYYWFALRTAPMVGNVTFRRLVEQFGSPQRVLEASASELGRIKGISPAVISSLSTHDYRKAADSECRAVEKSGARIIDFLSPDYPRLLLEIPDPPPFIYVKGEIAGCDPAIAVVGSRRATAYGIQATGRIAQELAEQGITVISGLARGIDTAAHQGALNAGGHSIGVLGCGIDVIYPAENRRLFAEMVEKGGIVSEFPMGTGPLAANFPRRNRLISGLSRGVLVVEAAERSGSLITAQFALEQGREVFAIPGAITSGASRGTHKLIRQGAKLVESVNDIMEELPGNSGGSGFRHQTELLLDPKEQAITGLLSAGPRHIDEIALNAGLTVQELSVMLLRLELRGVVIQLPGKVFHLS